MPFRRRFDCLWCGRTWGTRSDDDLEGWAALCPDCLAKADDNGFLRSRVRTALRDRAASAAATEGPPGDWEDWYLRRGRYAQGPIHDGPWTMELDEVTRWLDGLGISGSLVELGAGMGWWSGLLAEKGELWVYDDDGASLDAARTRLMAHGLLAHLHERDPLARPERTVDVVFAAYLLGGADSDQALDARLTRVTDWLKPGGSFAFVEAQGRDLIDGPGGELRAWDAEGLGGHLVAQGFGPVEIAGTQRSFVYGEAITPS